MCNQTEMYKEIAEYDRKAARGLVPERGIMATKKTTKKTKKVSYTKKTGNYRAA